MCGIAGILNLDPLQPVDRDELRRMTQAMEHRGPDGEGMEVRGPIGLGHRRLAIIDLSEAAAQPMRNDSGDIWLAFNGEFYGFREWRRALEKKGRRFTSSSDTEVVLRLYEEYGPEGIRHVDGMFAFALWDERKRLLWLARDRLGIKPLYYAVQDRRVLFASELKALLQASGIDARVDLRALDRYFSYLTVPGTDSILRGIRKLAPGHQMVVHDGIVAVSKYWDITPPAPREDRRVGATPEVLDETLSHAAASQLVSDVPVGIFLSGGIDSTCVAYWAGRAASTELHSFSISIPESPRDDESAYARAMAEACGFHHHELTVPAGRTEEMLRRMAWAADEPFAIASAVGVGALAEYARNHVKVVLTGDGGDELFAGYGRHLLSNGTPNGYLKRVLYVDEEWKRGLYTPALKALCDESACHEDFHAAFDRHAGAGDLWRRLYTDLKTTLVDEMLTKTDRMTMASGLEARVPLLDHRLVEWSMDLADEHKVAEGVGKRMLRAAVERYVGPGPAHRPKIGFNVAFGEWLRGPLRDLVRRRLSPERVKEVGLFEPEFVTRMVGEHLAGRDRAHYVFALLMFDLWLEAYPMARV